MSRFCLAQLGSVLLASLVILPTSSPCADLSIADLAGNWRYSGINTPTALRETYFIHSSGQTRMSANSQDFAKSGEQLVDTFFAGSFSTDNNGFSMTAQGGLSGGVSGTALVSKSRSVIATLNGQKTVLQVNASGDVMTLVQRDGQDQEFTLVVKQPSDASVAGLAGTWRFSDFGMPNDLTENYFNTVSMTSRNGLSSDFAGANEQLVDTFFSGGFETERGTVSIDLGGTISGDISGTAATTSSGVVSLTFDEGAETFYLNASKNFMIRALTESDEQRFTAVVKSPSSLALAELAGPWRFARLSMPNRLVENYFNGSTQTSRQSANSQDFAMSGENFVDLFFPGKFEVERGVFGIAADGSLAANFSGSVAVDAPGLVTFTVDGEALQFLVNESKDVMYFAGSNMDEQEIVIAVRTPLEPMKLALDLEDGKMNLLWPGQGDVKLQKSSTLGGWSDVMNSTGQSAYESSTTTMEFYRLLRFSPE